MNLALQGLRRRGLDDGMKRPLTRYRGSSPEGRAFGCASLGVWALPYAFVIQRRNWRDKTER